MAVAAKQDIGADMAKAPKQRSESTIRVVSNKAEQAVEDIARTPEAMKDDIPAPAPAARVVANPSKQVAENISDSAPASNAPRLANGFKVVRNRAYQRAQKIKRKKLRAPVSDEMDYKKLFTKFEEGFLSQDLEMIGECLSPAFQWRLPNGEVVYGKKEALAEMDRKFATPNGPKFERAIWRFEGETVLQSYKVEYMGPDGRWRKSTGFDIYEIGDGLITLKDAYWKMIP